MCSRSAPGGPGRANELGGQMVDLLTLAVFATIDEAAISGLKHAAAICDPQYECGGVVRAVPGGFEASALISSKRPFGVDLAEFYGPEVVADFHTHVCSIHNQAFADFFSMSDAIVNQELHTVGYMLSLCDRSEEHTLNSSHRCISYAVFCLKKKKRN